MFKFKSPGTALPKKLKVFLLGFAIVYLAGVLLLHLQQLFFPQQNDLLALAQVVSPYLLLTILFLIPILFLRGATVVRAGFVINLLIWFLRFGPALPVNVEAAAPDSAQLKILDWNVYVDNPTLEKTLDYILASSADVVTIQESNKLWDQYEPKLAANYPYRLASPYMNYGTILLSKYPILDSGVPEENLKDYGSSIIWARLDLGQGKHVVIVTVHPFLPNLWACRIPICYKAQARDAAVLRIKAQVLELMRYNEPILLVGDFNLTDRDPIYRELSASFSDVQKFMGKANQNTWKTYLPFPHTIFPVIRIDYMWHTAGIRPIQFEVDCNERGSDHCLLQGKMEIK